MSAPVGYAAGAASDAPVGTAVSTIAVARLHPPVGLPFSVAVASSHTGFVAGTTGALVAAAAPSTLLALP
jgi:hypothetical protein